MGSTPGASLRHSLTRTPAHSHTHILTLSHSHTLTHSHGASVMASTPDALVFPYLPGEVPPSTCVEARERQLITSPSISTCVNARWITGHEPFAIDMARRARKLCVKGFVTCQGEGFFSGASRQVLCFLASRKPVCVGRKRAPSRPRFP